MFGFGARPSHYPELLEGGAPVSLFEVISENFVDRGGRPRAVLERLRRDADVVVHGVSLSIGSTDPLDLDWIDRLKGLVDAVEPRVVSDHACFSGAHGLAGHDLWPMPYTEEAVAHVAARVGQVQERLGRQIALENVSSYVAWAQSEMSEWAFLNEIARRADCLLLLDVNNVFVNAYNHRFEAADFIDEIDAERVAQIHLAGHLDCGTHLFDDHAHDVPDPVWALYRRAVARLGDVPTIIERDGDIPSLEALIAEAQRIPRERAAAREVHQ